MVEDHQFVDVDCDRLILRVAPGHFVEVVLGRHGQVNRSENNSEECVEPR